MEIEPLSETDLEIVDAMQVNPRASFSAIGRALGITPATAARRWESLTSSGLAWTNSTAGSGISSGFILELSCLPGSTDEIVEQLISTPDIMTVGHLTGDFNVYAISVASSAQAMANFQMKVINHLRVSKIRTHLYHHAYGGSRRWRLKVINDRQALLLREDLEPQMTGKPSNVEHRDIYLALGCDARRSLSEIADEFGMTPQAIGRKIRRAQKQGILDLRADIARPLAGWHLGAFIWVSVAAVDLLSASVRLGRMNETRFCSSVSGPQRSILLTVSLHATEDLDVIVRRIETDEIAMHVVDCQFTLRLAKVDGRILDRYGRATRCLPVDPWASEQLSE